MNTRIALLTSLSLLLAACGQPASPGPTGQIPAPTSPTPATPTPAASSPGAVYEVSFLGANGGVLSASARQMP